ncbi:MAG: hypothetical protein RLZ35_1091 [Pseudomonadota bacterium]
MINNTELTTPETVKHADMPKKSILEQTLAFGRWLLSPFVWLGQAVVALFKGCFTKKRPRQSPEVGKPVIIEEMNVTPFDSVKEYLFNPRKNATKETQNSSVLGTFSSCMSFLFSKPSNDIIARPLGDTTTSAWHAFDNMGILTKAEKKLINSNKHS